VEHASTVEDAQGRVAEARREGWPVHFVPTMGAFHEGHLALMRRAKAEGGFTVVSLFVNPTQFGPREDFARYPRDMEGDSALAATAGADLLFTPETSEIYPPDHATAVEVTGTVTGTLEGAIRPGHFRGVTTVVAILFGIVQPTRAYFGEKDYQQLAVIRRMVADLWLPVEIVPCPTVREADGLAMSSRNRYLSPEERAAAPALFRALQAGQRAWQQGRRTAEDVQSAATEVIAAQPSFSVDYVAVADVETLAPLAGQVERPARLLLAARLGTTRLIDNAPVQEPTLVRGS
jgi:pantoate--beta-alanine ligase